MSPLRRRGGGRPRSAHSILDFAERWGISEKAARRLAGQNLSDEVMVLLARDSQRCAAAQSREKPGQGKYTGGMKRLGLVSRVAADRSNLVPGGDSAAGQS